MIIQYLGRGCEFANTTNVTGILNDMEVSMDLDPLPLKTGSACKLSPLLKCNEQCAVIPAVSDEVFGRGVNKREMCSYSLWISEQSFH